MWGLTTSSYNILLHIFRITTYYVCERTGILYSDPGPWKASRGLVCMCTRAPVVGAARTRTRAFSRVTKETELPTEIVTWG